jgi:uncharacterized protein YjcR
MKRLAQEARIRQGVVHYAEKYGKSAAARQYGVSLSSVKRWSKRVRWYMEVTARAFTPTKQASQTAFPNGGSSYTAGICQNVCPIWLGRSLC